MRRITKKTVAIAAGAIVLLGGAGSAYAYWTTSGGTGNGTGTTGTAGLVTVNQSAITGLYPGATAQTLSGTFNNASGGPVHVTTVTVSITSVTAAGGGTITGGCAADYALTGDTMDAVQEVPVGSAVGAWGGTPVTGVTSDATIQLTNTTANQDACQGATVHLAYVVA